MVQQSMTDPTVEFRELVHEKLVLKKLFANVTGLLYPMTFTCPSLTEIHVVTLLSASPVTILQQRNK